MTPKPKLGRTLLTKAKIWPGRAAGVVDLGIAAVEIYGAAEALSTAQKMKGDPDAVLAVAEFWRRSAEKLSDAQGPLYDAWNTLTTDWEGGAFDAFKATMDYNSSAADSNRNTLLSAENVLLNLSNAVTASYNSAVDLTTSAARTIEPALGNIFTGKDADKKTISEALLTYIESVNRADSELRTTINGQRRMLAEFANELTKLKDPRNVPERATDPSRWVYK